MTLVGYHGLQCYFMFLCKIDALCSGLPTIIFRKGSGYNKEIVIDRMTIFGKHYKKSSELRARFILKINHGILGCFMSNTSFFKSIFQCLYIS